MHPVPYTVGFAYVDCGASPFLCHVWQVQYPALVHFKTDEDGRVAEDTDPNVFEFSMDLLRPVEVRIFDLGLQQDTSLLPASVFPTMLAQMKSLTTQEGAHTIKDEYDPLMREYHQFHNLHYSPACDRRGSFLDYTSSLDNFLLKHIAQPLGLEQLNEIVARVAFSLSTVVGIAFYLIANPVSDFWSGFLGKPGPLDQLAEQLEERGAIADNGGILGGMQNGLMDFLEDFMVSKVAESAEQSAVTTQKDEMKTLLAQMRANMSSVLQGI